MPALPKSRTVVPNGEKIRQLRIARGLTIEDLAGSTGRSPRTISRLEQGVPTFVSTLFDVAQYLKLETSDLIDPAEGLEGAQPTPPTPGGYTVTIKLCLSLRHVDETTELLEYLEAIRKRFQLQDPMEIEGMAGGSISITVTLSERDMRRIVEELHKSEEWQRGRRTFSFEILGDGWRHEVSVDDYDKYVRDHPEQARRTDDATEAIVRRADQPDPE